MEDLGRERPYRYSAEETGSFSQSRSSRGYQLGYASSRDFAVAIVRLAQGGEADRGDSGGSGVDTGRRSRFGQGSTVVPRMLTESARIVSRGVV